MKRAGSGGGSLSQRYGSEDPEHCTWNDGIPQSFCQHRELVIYPDTPLFPLPVEIHIEALAGENVDLFLYDTYFSTFI